MLVRPPRCDSSARRAVDEAQLKQVGLIDVRDGIRVFTYRRGNRIESDWPSVELLYDGAKQLPVDLLEADSIYL